MFTYRLLQVTGDVFVLFILLLLASASLFVEVKEARFDSSAQHVREFLSFYASEALSGTQEESQAFPQPLFPPRTGFVCSA